MGAIEDYRARREARLSAKRAERIDAFRGRREKRLIARGILPVEYRSDAPEEEQENNNEENSGGHGNTRLPFGLCMRYGIPIEPSWGPSEAWEALKSKGITPEGAFSRLKEGKDPGTPDEGGDPGSEKAGEAEKVEPPKEPVKSVRIKTYAGDVDYDKLEGKFDTWAGRGTDKWILFGERAEGSYEAGGGRVPPSIMSERFHTKMDMFRWLKDKGVEEFPDPETGEIVNPVEMEIPAPVMTRGKTGYTGVSIGFRDGVYGVIGTDYDGKKKTLVTFNSLEDAKNWAIANGAKEEDIKISSATKKREAERVSWLTSDKKEYFEKDGERFGDIHIAESGSWWIVTGESEKGETSSKAFKTKTEAIAFLKDQGVQKAKYGKESLDPQEYEIPETVAEVGGKAMQDVGLKASEYGSDYYLYGKDLDGKVTALTYRYGGESHEEFLERIKSVYGIGGDMLSIDPDSKEKIDKILKAEKEFDEKAETFGDKKYTGLHIEKDDWDGSYRLVGYDRDGDERWIEGGGWYSLERDINRYGKDISQYIKDEDLRKSYDEYKEKMKDFDAKAVEIAGERYIDIKITCDGRRFYVKGTNAIGREDTIAEERYYDGLEKTLEKYGFKPTSFEMTDAAKKRRDKAVRAKELIATGEYYSLGQKEEAFKDIQLEYNDVAERYSLMATDMDGVRKLVDHSLTWDAAIGMMSDLGVKDYKITKKSGEEIPRPRWGMHGVILKRKPGGGFIVYADSHKYGKGAVMYETPKESEARKWLKDNNVPDEGIKTRGMNPNDDVPRTHTEKSLGNFDTHRMEAIEGSFIERLSEPEKQETADMLTEVFDKGAYRVARSPDSFGGIIENGYKSQIETGTGGRGAFLSKTARKNVSNKMYGHGGLADNEYEKCGYLGFEDEAEDYEDDAHPFYGDITYTFKKDRMKDRVTYTFGDSLNRDHALRSAGYGGSNPTIEGMSALYDDDDVRRILETYKSYKRGDISYSEMFKEIREGASNNYIELQYHGPVTVEDIEKVSFQNERDLKSAFSQMSSSQRKRVIKKLKDNGVGLIYRTSDEQPFKDAWPWVEEHYKEDMPT